MTTKLGEQLKEHFNICNCHGLLKRFGGKQDVECYYRPYDPRSHFGGGSYVYSPWFPTEPGGPWYNHGQKHFVGDRVATLPLAIEWARARYGIDEWVTSPFDRSGKVPKRVLDKAKAAVKAKQKEQS